jgi:uncharacterized membrane protein YhdT
VSDHPTRDQPQCVAENPTWRATWPLYLIALGAFVAIWGGWVGLGGLTGFGPIHLLPGIADEFVLNSAITLPLGLEAYAAMALRYFLVPPSGIDPFARKFAGWSALGSLVLGASGQIAYHLMVADGLTKAPWQITAAVSCLPVVVLGCAAALIHLIYRTRSTQPVEDPTDNKQSVVTVGQYVDGRAATMSWAPPVRPVTVEDELQKLLDETPTDRFPTAEPTGPTDEYDRGLDSGAINEVLVADMQQWAADRGRPVSRDEAIKAYGIGATRARTLRLACGWPRSVDEDADQPTAEPTAVGKGVR